MKLDLDLRCDILSGDESWKSLKVRKINTVMRKYLGRCAKM